MHMSLNLKNLQWKIQLSRNYLPDKCIGKVIVLTYQTGNCFILSSFGCVAIL